MLNRFCIEIILISLIFEIIDILLPSGKIRESTRFVVLIYFINFMVRSASSLIVGGLNI